jgi:hypothetical protein
VSNDYESDGSFPGVWIIAKYILERNIDRTLEFATADWLLKRNEDELALKVSQLHMQISNEIIVRTCSIRIR